MKIIPIRKKNATNRPFVETRFIASLRKDVLQSLIELVQVNTENISAEVTKIYERSFKSIPEFGIPPLNFGVTNY
ncbi:hypothetical protein CK516_01740 [Nostoc sp. 'Peltigera malacea cyanobiont' DB3992]|nr:hypothetical protein CK516_01740 [Nostoc sp. 'Peltigera malacea cyanobiont' DB3992]